MNISVALVDDQVLFRKGLKKLLKSSPRIHVQSEANNGTALIKDLTQAAALPDICIISSTALMLKDNWTIKKIKRRFKQIKVLVLASYCEEFMVAKLNRDGVDGFLLKTASPAELKKAIATLHAYGRYWQKDAAKVLESAHTKYYINTLSRKPYLDFLTLCNTELTYEEMGRKMGVSARAVQGYRDYIFSKIKVNSRTGIVLFALKNGMIELK